MADHVHAQRFGAMTPGYYLNEQLVTVGIPNFSDEEKGNFQIIDDFLPTDIANAQGRLHISITKLKVRTNTLETLIKIVF